MQKQFNGERSVFIPTQKGKKKSDLYFILYTEINSKWMIDQKVKIKIIKYLEENEGGNSVALN